MEQAGRRALLIKLQQQARLSRAPRREKFRHLRFRLALPRLLSATGLKRRVFADTFFGCSMRVPLPDLVGAELYEYGFFEEGLTRAIIETLPEGGVFVDIGAHVGYYSILASLLVAAQGRVVAFEPTPRTRTELVLNTAELSNVEVVPLAAWDRSIRLTLQDSGERPANFNSVLAPRLNGKSRHQTIEVDAIAVDDWLEAQGIVPSFIKIDAESAEHRVLRGLKRTIERHRPMLSLEIGDYNRSGVPPSADIIRSLLALGYSAWQYRGGTFVQHRIAERYGPNNLIFMPNRTSRRSATAWPGAYSRA